MVTEAGLEPTASGLRAFLGSKSLYLPLNIVNNLIY